MRGLFSRRNYDQEKYRKRKESGLCTLCGKPVLDGKTKCESHLKQARSYYKKKVKLWKRITEKD